MRRGGRAPAGIAVQIAQYLGNIARKSVAHGLIASRSDDNVQVGSCDMGDNDHEPDPDDDEDRDPDETPETPLDEPQPTPVQDPPSEPIQVPYVVRGA
jgi:hypothetical protein